MVPSNKTQVCRLGFTWLVVSHNLVGPAVAKLRLGDYQRDGTQYVLRFTEKGGLLALTCQRCEQPVPTLPASVPVLSRDGRRRTRHTRQYHPWRLTDEPVCRSDPPRRSACRRES